MKPTSGESNEDTTSLEGVRGHRNNILHFPAGIYLVFALIGVLFLIDKGVIESGAREKTGISTVAEEHPTCAQSR